LGIRAPGLNFKGTGYAYAEMTQPSLVGVVPEKLAGDIELESQPVVVRIGTGEAGYEAGEQITYIEKRLAEVRKATERLGTQITARNAELEALRTSLESSKQQAQSTSDPTAAAAAVERHNRLVSEHNAVVASLNGLVAQHNTLVEAQRYAAEHQTARPQVYDRLRGLKL
jgi:chromosome segregation ATPase